MLGEIIELFIIEQIKKPQLCSVLLQSTQEAVDHERSVDENTRRSLLLECSIAS